MADDKLPPEDDNASGKDASLDDAPAQAPDVDALNDTVQPEATADYGPAAGAYEEDDSQSINQGIPAVAQGGTKNVFVLGVGLVVAGIFLWNLLVGDDDDVAQQEQQREQELAAEQRLPVPPPAPIESEPTPVVAPPPPPPPPPISSSTDSQSTGTGGRASRGLTLPPDRARADLLVGSNTVTALGLALQGGAEASPEDTTLQDTPAPQVDATYAGEPSNLIAQGKIIDAVLETAVNSDLSGILRAIVSRDIYAEAGKRVLVPKGSRLVGTYDVDVRRGQSRVFIVWNRVIRPDGIDLVINSPGSDQLGRAGIAGEVNNKYLEIFSNAILLSSITVAYAFGAEEILDTSGLTETENTSGSLTTSGDPSAIASVEAIDDFGDVVKGVTAELVDLRPTITIDQGTRVKVFVNRDVKFPSTLANDIVFIR